MRRCSIALLIIAFIASLIGASLGKAIAEIETQDLVIEEDW